MSGKPRAKILAPTPENIAFAASELRSHEIGGMPTETVYGLAGNALEPLALAKIFDAKARPKFDPLIVHVSPALAQTGKRAPTSISSLSELGLVDGGKLPSLSRKKANALIDRFWPGPLTLVLPKLAQVPDLATSGFSAVALRMPSHPVAQALIDAAGFPLAAPSANRFGRISPTRARHVIEELGSQIGWVLDGGDCAIGVESTVIALREDGEFGLLRPGGIPAAEIEAVLKSALFTVAAHAPESMAPAPGPGMLASHYAPAKPLFMLSDSLTNLEDESLARELSSHAQESQRGPWGVIALSGEAHAISSRILRLTGRNAVVRTLSRDGSLPEAAKNLFSELRALDASSAEILFAEPIPRLEGLGHALQDRLKRASKRAFSSR